MAAWSSWASPSRRPTTTTGMPITRPGATIMPMPAEVSNPQLSWNLARDAGELLEYHFMINALLAGSVVAVTGGGGGGGRRWAARRGVPVSPARPRRSLSGSVTPGRPRPGGGGGRAVRGAFRLPLAPAAPETTQIPGVLLVFALPVGPAATAQAIT